MNFFKTELRRKFLFACLYMSEGAPIGFLWLTLPTRLRGQAVPVEEITTLTAMLVLPWTFKFAWAPLIDLLTGRRWTMKHWIMVAQCVMGVTLLPLLWLDPVEQFCTLTRCLMVHAIAAATQDVAIDALCISTSRADERGRINGWMQAGMLLGRAMMGGGALVMANAMGDGPVIILLIFVTTFSLGMLVFSKPPPREHEFELRYRIRELATAIGIALRDRNTWLGFTFAFVGGAAFKSLEVIYGPFLIDRGFEESTIGWFSLGPMIGAMIVGSLMGGYLTDRLGPRRCVIGSLLHVVTCVTLLALTDWHAQQSQDPRLLVLLAVCAVGIGVFTSSSYALFMDITYPGLAATQFSGFMGATNGCESWSTFVAGYIISTYGYPAAMIGMSAVSLLAMTLVFRMVLPEDQTRQTGSEREN